MAIEKKSSYAGHTKGVSTIHSKAEDEKLKRSRWGIDENLNEDYDLQVRKKSIWDGSTNVEQNSEVVETSRDWS